MQLNQFSLHITVHHLEVTIQQTEKQILYALQENINLLAGVSNVKIVQQVHIALTVEWEH